MSGADLLARDSGTIKVWDLPLRLCHWSFALLVPALWWTAENSQWAWHKRLGITLLGVLMFRVVWGFVGPSTARFSDFVKGPRAILAYLRGDPSGAEASKAQGGFNGIGHSPIGALSVIALLGVLIAQASFGLFAGDQFDGATGPLNGLVGVLTAAMLTDWHETLFDVILVLIALHLAAIAFYWIVKRNNLVAPMITGKRPALTGQIGIARPSAIATAVTFVVASGFAVWMGAGAPPLQ